MPQELVGFASILPLVLADQALQLATRKPGIDAIRLEYSPEALAAVSVAFKAWLASLDMELTPGWALIAAYSMAITSAVPSAIAQAAERGKVAQAVPSAVPEVKQNAPEADTDRRSTSGGSSPASPA